MKLGKATKIAIGLATLLVVFIPLSFLVLWLMGPVSPSVVLDSFEFVFQSFELLSLVLCVVNLVIYALVAFYIAHLIKNREISDAVKIVLAIALFFIPYLAMPAYFLIYVWPERPLRWGVTLPGDS